METHYTKIFTGSFIIAQLIQTRLEDIGIEPILKDGFKTGLRAVLVTEYPRLIEIFVHNDELDKAIPVVAIVKAELQT
jgi:Putative prokaryotic signal transducing protein